MNDPAERPGPPSAGEGRIFGRTEFAAEEKDKIRQLLGQKLGKEYLSERPGAGGAKYTYIESHKAIQLANEIFGFNGWSSSVVDVTPDFIEEIPGRFIVGVTAVVKVLLKDGTFHEDVGYGISENPKKGQAIENAKKEAVTDARKRALRMFGNALGNCVYDKQHTKKFRAEKTDEFGFVVEPAKAPLMPQHALPPAGVGHQQHAVPAPNPPAPAAPPPQKSPTINYSPPQAGGGGGRPAAAAAAPTAHANHAATASYHHQPHHHSHHPPPRHSPAVEVVAEQQLTYAAVEEWTGDLPDQ